MGLRQIQLAKALNISSQQIYKFEQCIDRIPAGRLIELAKLLSVPIMYFYEEGEGIIFTAGKLPEEGIKPSQLFSQAKETCSSKDNSR